MSLKSHLVILACCAFSIFNVSAQYDFTAVENLECSNVKSQDKTGTCWSFATTSFIESELVRNGDDAADLSEMYFVRQNYLRKAQNYLLRQGKANFSEGSLSHDVTYVLENYGAMPESAYPGRSDMSKPYNHSEMVAVMKGALGAMLKKGKLSGKWPEVMNAIMDVYMGPLPESFTVDGKKLTSESYAEALDLDAGEYVSLTSFTHHPFYEKCILEIPDNYSNGAYYNIPLDQLIEVIDNGLAKGYTIAWDGDVSEDGFDAKKSLAVLPVDSDREDLFDNPGPEVAVDQDLRQAGFESLATTDDHLMHIVGKATDQNGTTYYIVKNSWGTIGPAKGFVYMSLSYLKMKTIAVMVHEGAVPEAIFHKFNTAMSE